MVERYVPGKKHLFTPGTPKPEGSGRKPGQKNRVTVLLKTAIEMAAIEVGEPAPLRKKNRQGKEVGPILGFKATGKDGLTGYLRWLALNEPVAFTGLLAKLLPLQINATAAVEHTVKSRFAGVDVSKLTLLEAQALYREAISLTRPLPVAGPVIEHNAEEKAA